MVAIRVGGRQSVDRLGVKMIRGIVKGVMNKLGLFKHFCQYQYYQ